MNPRPPLKPFSFSHATKPKPIPTIKAPAKKQPTDSTIVRSSTLFDDRSPESTDAWIAEAAKTTVTTGEPTPLEEPKAEPAATITDAPIPDQAITIPPTTIDSTEAKERNESSSQAEATQDSGDQSPSSEIPQAVMTFEIPTTEPTPAVGTEGSNEVPIAEMPATEPEAVEPTVAMEPNAVTTTKVPEAQAPEPATVPAKAKAPRKQTKASTATKPAPTTTPNANAMGNPKPRPVPPNAAKRFSALDAAAKVLTGSAPLNASELIETMRIKGLWVSPHGRTPHATLHSAIMREIRVKGDASRFEKVGRGRFTRRKTA